MAPFVHRLRVRYNECDAQGHVFNANYFVYFDVTLTELWREALGSYGALTAGGLDLVVAETGARFRSPARFDDELDITLEIERLGNTSMASAIAIARRRCRSFAMRLPIRRCRGAIDCGSVSDSGWRRALLSTRATGDRLVGLISSCMQRPF